MKFLKIAMRMVWLSRRRPKAPGPASRIHLAPF